MNNKEQEETKLRSLLLKAIDAYKDLEEAKKKLESARADFGYAKLYKNEPRLINVDGVLWEVTVPFPRNREDYDDCEPEQGTISFKVLGKFL